ncbi:MAG: DUF4347 domain-containing protein, partial [Oscillatoriales cyanobacterium]
MAAGELGENFVNKIGYLTGADIAASTDLTGSALLGGNWNLEKLTGAIESPLAFQVDAIADYQSTLAVDCQPNVIYAIANGNVLITSVNTGGSITLPTPTPDADLAVTKTDGQTTATPGTLLSYTVTIKGISFTDNLPASLTGVTWTASLSGVGAFPTAADRSGSGNNINTKLDLDAGSTATYIVTGTVANSAIDT